jgi:hypothetical protein
MSFFGYVAASESGNKLSVFAVLPEDSTVWPHLESEGDRREVGGLREGGNVTGLETLHETRAQRAQNAEINEALTSFTSGSRTLPL